MSGHWAYIWPTYLASGLAISLLSVLIWRRGRKLRQKLDLIERRRDTGPEHATSEQEAQPRGDA